ncbi:hypothetical protein EXIGLDRAFT_224406 [Exidia glandulosa HHB12029]|uniref:C3H1-type domain-containing protein n=1 Tax=Exidia glandulosa HHB12029 TaxID=1314781 RepID=A0A165EAG6_EXIGL|nr:hypothetical protein EXIGLDRAFT_224406 [Exidia glandulosa HHB12029]
MFYSTYRRGSNGEIIDPSLLPAPVQAQKSLYYRTKPCRYWNADGSCPKGDKCTFIHDPALQNASSSTTSASPASTPGPSTPVSLPSTLRLPAPKPAREPHPAWRVVGGGVTLASMGVGASEDSQDEDDVEGMMQVDSQPSQSSQSQPQYAQAQVQYASPQSQGYAAPLPSPVMQQPVANFPQQYTQQPGAPMFAYAYPAPAYYQPSMYSPGEERRGSYMVPVLVPAEQLGMMPYYIAPTPHGALSFEVPRTEDNVDELAQYAIDVSGVDGSARPFDAPEVEHYLGQDDEEEVECESGSILLDPPVGAGTSRLSLFRVGGCGCGR